MKEYIKPTLDVTDLMPEESIALSGCRRISRYFAWFHGCRKWRVVFSTNSVS